MNPAATAPRLLALVVGDETMASTRQRVLGYLGALRAAGFDPRVRFEPRWSHVPVLRRLGRLRELLATTRFHDADLVMIQRRTFPPWFARRLARQPQGRVFDFDDAIDLPPPTASPTARDLLRYRRNFLATVAVSDRVLCGNSVLAGRVPHGRCEVLPTPVDARRFCPGALPVPSGPVLGWVGHGDNLGYLEALAEPLAEIGRRHRDLKLVVVSDRRPELPHVAVEFRPWSLGRELEGFADIAVGLAPLADTEWTRAKCAFRLLQYMSLGVPAVASPVGMQAEVGVDGVSVLLARNGHEWVRAVDSLLRDRELRLRLARAARKEVEQRFDVPIIARRLIAVLEDLLARHGHSRAGGRQ